MEAKETVLISGGTGLVGTSLCRRLLALGYRVKVLTRTPRPNREVEYCLWDWENGEVERSVVQDVDYIIHLAGENIGQERWTQTRKERLRDSRVKSAECLLRAVESLPRKPKAFITASAIGYYGAITSSKKFKETDAPGADFLGEICVEWENAAHAFEPLGLRTVIVRCGIVLAEKGGALAEMVRPVRLGFGSPIGSGRQYVPWIHLDDVCGIYVQALTDASMKGPYNAVAPEGCTHRKFMKTLSTVLNKPFWFPPIPALFLKMLLGQRAQLLLEGSRVASDRIQGAGYVFKFPSLEGALKELLKKA
jgi:uncharacterized protein (TIGR01777 family)